MERRPDGATVPQIAEVIKESVQDVRQSVNAHMASNEHKVLRVVGQAPRLRPAYANPIYAVPRIGPAPSASGYDNPWLWLAYPNAQR